MGPIRSLNGWDESLLTPVADLNEQLLESLCQQSNQGEAAPRLVRSLQPQLADLDAGAMTRLAACPYLLIDAGLGRPELWARPAGFGVSDVPLRGGYFVNPAGVSLVRRTLLFAWHLARANRLAARVVAGMDALTCEQLVGWRLKDLDGLAERAPSWIVPRWESRPLIWRQLLQRAARADAAGLRRAQLRGLQLLAGEPLTRG